MHRGGELRCYGTDAEIIAAAVHLCTVFPFATRAGEPSTPDSFSGITNADEIIMDDNGLRYMIGAVSDIAENRSRPE